MKYIIPTYVSVLILGAIVYIVVLCVKCFLNKDYWIGVFLIFTLLHICAFLYFQLCLTYPFARGWPIPII